MPTTKKRHSAFDDFPTADSSLPGLPQPPLQPAASVLAAAPAPQVERIERLKPSQMLPDRFQPRRLLPRFIREDFFSGKLDCYQAAQAWVVHSSHDPAMRAEIDRLLLMGVSFEEHGQIKPITGSWVSASDGSYVFLIETGERRFWAACLRHVIEEEQEEPLLRVEVVAAPTRQRQVLENRHAEPPSAVEQACEVSSLILAELGIAPDPALEDDYDFFRQARAQRMPAGLWERITPIMQLTRPRMVQLLNILQLPTPLLDLADRSRLPERVLREILSSPREQWERLIKLSVQNQLTSDEVSEAAAAESKPATPQPARETYLPDPSRAAARGLRRFTVSLGELDEFGQAQALDEIADSLIVTGHAEQVMKWMEELARLLAARMYRK